MKSSDEFNIEHETATSRNILEAKIPYTLNAIKLKVIEITKEPNTHEPWRIALTIDFIETIERNCEQLLETLEKDKQLPTAAWLARNMLEVWVWVRYCGVSRENAWRFREDALRDAKGMVEAHAKCCLAFGFADETSAASTKLIQEVANQNLGLEDIDSGFLAVSNAAKAPGVDLASIYGATNRLLSKFAHPTAGLIHGVTHQKESCRNLQASFTTEGVCFAAQSILALETQLGIPRTL